MDQGLTREEGDSMEEKESIFNPSDVQEPTTSGVHRRRVYLDKNLVYRISETIEDQIMELIKQIQVPTKQQNNKKQDGAVDLPSPSMIREEDVGDSPDNKRKRGRKPTSKPCGEIFGSLQLPNNEIMNNIDFHNVCSLTKVGDKISVADNNPTFSFQERLQDWKIEQRQRKFGSTKYYLYYHSLSNKKFRSKPEVIQFVLTETCPPQPGTSRKKYGKCRKRSNKRRKTPKTSRNEKTKVGDVICQNVVEGVVSEHLNATVVGEDQVVATVTDHLGEKAQSSEIAVSDRLNEATIVNQDPSSASNALTIETKVSSHHEELQMSELMSTEEMLNEFSIAFQRGEI